MKIKNNLNRLISLQTNNLIIKRILSLSRRVHKKLKQKMIYQRLKKLLIDIQKHQDTCLRLLESKKDRIKNLLQ